MQEWIEACRDRLRGDEAGNSHRNMEKHATLVSGVRFHRGSKLLIHFQKLLSDKNRKNIKASEEKRIVFLHLLHFRDLSDTQLEN